MISFILAVFWFLVGVIGMFILHADFYRCVWCFVLSVASMISFNMHLIATRIKKLYGAILMDKVPDKVIENAITSMEKQEVLNGAS